MKRFTTKDKRAQHEIRQHPNADFVCDICNLRFITKQKIAQHLVKVHLEMRPDHLLVKKKVYKCGVCKKIISNKEHLKRHKRQVHLNLVAFMCEICSETYKDRRCFNRHLAKRHGIIATIKGESLKCPTCDKVIKQQHRFEAHKLDCILKRQEALNRKIDLDEGHFVQVSRENQDDYEIETKFTVDSYSSEVYIKQEPIDPEISIPEVILGSIKNEPSDTDPINMSQNYSDPVSDHELTVKRDPTQFSDFEASDRGASPFSDDWPLQQDGNPVPFTQINIKEDFEHDSESNDDIGQNNDSFLKEPFEEDSIDKKRRLTRERVQRFRSRQAARILSAQENQESNMKTELETREEPCSQNDKFSKTSNKAQKKKRNAENDSIDGEDPIERRRRINRERKRKWRAQLDEETLKRFRKKDAEKKALSRAAETLEEAKARRDYDNEKHRIGRRRSREFEVVFHQAEMRPKSPPKIIEPVIKQEPIEVQQGLKMKLVTVFKCSLCPEKFNNKDAFAEHFKIFHVKLELPQIPPLVKKYKCKTCTELFDSIEAVKRHNVQMHVDGAIRKVRERYRDDQDESESEGEPEKIDENDLMRMFKAETFNCFAKVFNCTICNKEFESVTDLKIHCVQDHRIKKFKCTKCNHSFNREHKFIIHWKKMHAELKTQQSFHFRDYPIKDLQHTCPHCPKTFVQNSSMRYHIRLTHCENRPIWFCDQCALTCNDRRTLDNHILKHHSKEGVNIKRVSRSKNQNSCNKCEFVGTSKEIQSHQWSDHYHVKILKQISRYECLICKETMKSRATAQRHYIVVHENGTKPLRVCFECTTAFELYDDFEFHVQNHGSSHICLICGISFTNHIELSMHKKTHRPVLDHEKKFLCDLCGFRSAQKSTLVKHMANLHGGVKPTFEAACENCGKAFTSYVSFHTHKKFHCGNQKSEKMKCAFCEKSYSTLQNLRAHEKGHTHPETFYCEHAGCNKHYTNFLTFQHHKSSHRTGSGKQCQVCSAVFSSRPEMILHVEMFHPEQRAHHCYLCGKTFPTEISCRNHIAICQASKYF